LTPAKAVPAVRRASAILWLLAEADDIMTLSQIARATDILPSTALHILRELHAARLIAIDPVRKGYALGAGLVDLGRAVCRQNDFAEIARPFLHALATRFDVTATATAEIDEEHMSCVASANPPDAMSLNVTVGGRVPILAGAVGRCVAAHHPGAIAELRMLFDRVRWQGPLGFDDWSAQVALARERGYATDEGLFARGVTTLAVPVLSADGRVSRAIGIASISALLGPTDRDTIAAALIGAASDIARKLHCSAPLILS
jgi:DNA-binding IclR family transcriptional regulator